MYYEQYDHEKISLAYKSFINGQTVSKSKLRPEIYDSWQRCVQNGIDTFEQGLPERLPKEYIFQNVIKDYHRVAYRHTFSLQETQKKYLDRLEVISYFADPDLVLFDPKGNETLRKELVQIDFGGGSNLGESIIGTNALNITKLTQKPFWSIGAEHYAKCLHDYVMFCIPVYYTDEKNNAFTFFSVLVTRLRNFSPQIEDFFKYYHAIHDMVISNTQWGVFKQHITREILTYQMEQNNLGIIVTDAQGVIIDLNAHVLSYTTQSSFDIIGKSLVQKWPELDVAYNCLKTGKSLTAKEVRINNSTTPMIMDCVPVKRDDIIIGLYISISDNVQIQKLTRQVINFRSHYSFDDIVGNHPSFIQCKNLAAKVAKSNSTVLITGESGTGKELFAQSIHTASPRRSQPFVSLNCAAIPRELIGSELFGYVDGAFTGARKKGARGKFELANKGTLFLDEISELPLDMQSIFLRAIEEREIVRLGDNAPIPIDVRIIAATNKNLKNLVENGTFRSDLYFRINVFLLEISPLRNRKDDIPLLIEDMLVKFANSFGKYHIKVSPDALQALVTYAWPGNVRELRNVIESALNICTSNRIELSDLPTDLLSTYSQHIPQSLEDTIDNIQQINDQHEKAIIQALLIKYKGNKSKVAREMGISRQTIYRKIDKYFLK